MNIDDLWRDMLFSVDKCQRIMVTRYKDNLALKQIMEKGEYFRKPCTFFLLVVGLFVVITVHNISSDQTIIKMQRVVAYVLSQFMEILIAAMNVTDENDV